MAFRAIVHIQAFRAIISLQFGVQSRIYNLALRAIILTFRRSEPPSLISSASRATIFSQLWHSEPPSLFSLSFRAVSPISAFRATIPSYFGIQSHHLSSVWRSESLSFHYLAFKAIILSRSGIRCHIFNIQSYIHGIQNRRSQFGVQSRCLFLKLKAIISRVWHLESLVSLAFRAIMSSFLAFRAIVLLGIRCLHLSLVLAFRVVVHTHSSI